MSFLDESPWRSIEWFMASEESGNKEMVVSGSDDGDSLEVIDIMMVDPDMGVEMVTKLAHHEIDGGCSCAHDCCGHWFSSVRDVTRIREGMYAILISKGRNV